MKSQYTGISWNARDAAWNVIIRVQGHVYYFGRFNIPDEATPAELLTAERDAAERADLVRWQLQDYLARKPRYNFPELIVDKYISPPEGCLPKVRQLRESYHKGCVPRHPRGHYHKLFDGDVL